MHNPNRIRVTLIQAALADIWNEAELEHALLVVHRLAGDEGRQLCQYSSLSPEVAAVAPVVALEQSKTKKDKKRITPKPPKLTPEEALAKRRESKAKYQSKVRAAAQPTERACAHCGTAFTSADPRSKFCSRKCGKYNWEAKQDPEKRRAHWRQKARDARVKKAASKAIQGQPEQSSNDASVVPQPQPPPVQPVQNVQAPTPAPVQTVQPAVPSVQPKPAPSERKQLLAPPALAAKLAAPLESPAATLHRIPEEEYDPEVKAIIERMARNRGNPEQAVLNSFKDAAPQRRHDFDD
jgi:hypothetical protein